MTQPTNPQQPYQPAQPYGAQQYTPGYSPSQPSAPQAGGVPQQAQQPYQQAVTVQESFFSNLFDMRRGFADRFGAAIFYTAVVAFLIGWFYSAYLAGQSVEYTMNGPRDTFDVGDFLVSLFTNAPFVALKIFFSRMAVEAVTYLSRISAHHQAK
ncbi:hypothetical protein [Actinomyces vulturis]|uniref:hypothetical protein n=1 Tax=Actinomyces vulturis TaxID=1857645 RepID=UPI00082F39BB|nr:hypothetical protein [Actinomyces vulturis]